MADLSIDYERCLKKFGEPYGGERLAPMATLPYRDHLPSTFQDFIHAYGLGKWSKGYFQFCDPEKYRPILDIVLNGDRDLKPERSHVVGFSAFGRLLVWNEDHEIVEIDPVYRRVLSAELFEPDPDPDGDISLGVALANVDAGSFDLSDGDGRPLFERVLKACGELEFGEIYALKLHPALGGSVSVENFRAADALAALTLAAQAAPFTLYNSTVPQVPAVRTVGGSY